MKHLWIDSFRCQKTCAQAFVREQEIDYCGQEFRIACTMAQIARL